MVRAGFVEHIRRYGDTDAVFAPSFAHDHRAALDRLTAPTLVINGDTDGMTASDREISGACGLPFVAVPDCPAHVPYRPPEVFADTVLGFIGA